MSRYLVLYLTTLAVLAALDFLFFGIVAKGFFASEVGDIRPVPAVLFYLLYVAGVLIFVSGPAPRPGHRRLSTARCSACSARRPSISPRWRCSRSWAVAAVDVSWGAAVTAIAASAGLIVANAVADDARA